MIKICEFRYILTLIKLNAVILQRFQFTGHNNLTENLLFCLCLSELLIWVKFFFAL